MTDATQTVPEKTRDAIKAAHLYYMQDLTMEAIARELHTSRSSVSRLLSFARDKGLVSIKIRSPHDRASELNEELMSRFGVAGHIVPVPDQISDIDRLERVAVSAARILDQFFDSNMTLGIAWGSTVSAVSRYLVPKAMHNSQIVQLNGAGNNRTSGILYASEILRKFGDAFGAHVEQFPVPAFFDDPATKAALWRERSTSRVLEIQRSMDVALFGVGSPLAQVPSHVYMGGYLEPDDYASLERDGVVGDVATVFYRLDGSSDGIALNERASGPDLAVLRRAARRVCVASGISKLQSLRGALAARLVTDLIVDEGTARALVQD
ncbi:sugar-binding transcriptional regulator [Galbitalea soli]|uniref:MarR family transcriptional regulator n=1 Tax=Galbitalea soli TaxID=1268042 RepID=A0A7C9PPB9_9MICO|nr:sugar-binding domain-containing protein [Galbitalea soli]NEM92225.1 MarR family transcriptional regulator [Galbitalea soli]NYJ31821.1 DNA-binding transcriptional regulator LsrR (DeoR family) [Galbitalea soli]